MTKLLLQLSDGTLLEQAPDNGLHGPASCAGCYFNPEGTSRCELPGEYAALPEVCASMGTVFQEADV